MPSLSLARTPDLQGNVLQQGISAANPTTSDGRAANFAEDGTRLPPPSAGHTQFVGRPPSLQEWKVRGNIVKTCSAYVANRPRPQTAGPSYRSRAKTDLGREEFSLPEGGTVDRTKSSASRVVDVDAHGTVVSTSAVGGGGCSRHEPTAQKRRPLTALPAHRADNVPHIMPVHKKSRGGGKNRKKGAENCSPGVKRPRARTTEALYDHVYREMRPEDQERDVDSAADGPAAGLGGKNFVGGLPQKDFYLPRDGTGLAAGANKQWVVNMTRPQKRFLGEKLSLEDGQRRLAKGIFFAETRISKCFHFFSAVCFVGVL